MVVQSQTQEESHGQPRILTPGQEARMLEVATRARIFGYDAPVLEDKRYQEALSGLQSRGGDICIIVNARQLLKSQSTFSKNFEVRVAPYDFLVGREQEFMVMGRWI